jgi:hypothetical protein
VKITTAWADNEPLMVPDLVSAYTEYDFDEWGDVPKPHADAVAKARGEGVEVRELVIEVPDEAVEALFATPTVTGTVVES